MVAGVHIDHIVVGVQYLSAEQRVGRVPVDGVNRGERVRRESGPQGGQDEGDRSPGVVHLGVSGRIKTAVIFGGVKSAEKRLSGWRCLPNKTKRPTILKLSPSFLPHECSVVSIWLIPDANGLQHTKPTPTDDLTAAPPAGRA